MKMLVDSLIFSNFNYCSIVWHFCSAALLQKIVKIQEHALRLVCVYVCVCLRSSTVKASSVWNSCNASEQINKGETS